MINIFESNFTNEEKEAALKVLDSGWFLLGEETKKFEENFAKYIGTKYAVGCSNGTAAILLSLEAIGIKQGDEVIVPSHTAFPTIQPILNLRAKPIFVDVDDETYTLDVEDVKKKITEKTRVILPVHLYGHPADLDPLKELCDKNNIYLVEDCAQAHGTEYKRKKVGSIGHIGCFSFYPSKNMTVGGDGGVITTDDEEIYKKLLLLRNHGFEDRYSHAILGYNYRISELSCAIGNVQLKRLDEFNNRRREIAKIYNEELKDLDLILPIEKEYAKHVYHLYVIRAKNRDKLREHLTNNKIGSQIHYPIPGHLQKATPNEFRKSLPKTEKVVNEILSLPMHTKLSDEDVVTVCDSIKEFLENK